MNPNYISTYNPTLSLAERIAQQEEAVRIVAVLNVAVKYNDPLVKQFTSGLKGTIFTFCPKDSDDVCILFRTSPSKRNAAALVYNAYNNFIVYDCESKTYYFFEHKFNFEAPEQFEEEDTLFQLSCTESDDIIINKATMAYAREYGLDNGTYWLEYVDKFIETHPEIWKQLEDTYWNLK